MKHSYLNIIKPLVGIEPSGTDNALTSVWVNLKDYEGAIFVIFATDDAAGDDVAVTLREAQSNTGTGARALTPRAWYRASGSAFGEAFTQLTTAAVTIEGSENNVLIVEVDAAELDVNNDYTHVQVQTDNGGDAGKVLACVALAVGPRHATAFTELPAALT